MCQNCANGAAVSTLQAGLCLIRYYRTDVRAIVVAAAKKVYVVLNYAVYAVSPLHVTHSYPRYVQFEVRVQCW